MIELFKKFETNHNLFQRKISGEYFWHLIRYDVYNEILYSKENIMKPHRGDANYDGFRKVINRIKQINNSITNNPFRNLEQRDIVVLNHQRRVKEYDLYKCIYTSDLLDNLEKSFYMYEDMYLEDHLKPTYEQEVRYTDAINLKYIAKKINYKLMNKSILSDEDISLLNNLFSNIINTFNIELRLEYWLNKTADKILFHKVCCESYERILNKIKPKVILEVVSYSGHRYAINQVAKKLRIPTIELQHGVIGNRHIAYNFQNPTEIITFPDNIFTFGEYWKDVTNFPISKDRVYSTGWSYFEKKHQKSRKLIKDKKYKVILFESQGTIGRELSKVAIDLSKKIDQSNYKIIYKLHPGEYNTWKVDYPWLIDEKVEVIDNNDKDMHYFYSKSDIQVGVNSTTIFEGLAYNLPTFIIDLYGAEIMIDLIEKKYARLVNTTDELMAEILKIDSNVETFKVYSDNYFWESNSLEKTITAINNIISK